MKRTRKISAPLRFGLALFCMALVSVTVLGAELTILTWMGVDHVALYRELLDEFEAEHGVTVNIIRTGTSALWEKLDTMILAGTPPDVFFMSGEHLAKYHATGVLEPLDEWAARTGADLDDFFPPSLEQYRIDGKLYAIPYDFGNRVDYQPQKKSTYRDPEAPRGGGHRHGNGGNPNRGTPAALEEARRQPVTLTGRRTGEAKPALFNSPRSGGNGGNGSR